MHKSLTYLCLSFWVVTWGLKCLPTSIYTLNLSGAHTPKEWKPYECLRDRDQILMHADIVGAFSSKPYSSSFQLPFHSTCTCAHVHMSVDSHKSKVIFLRGKAIRNSRGTEDGGGITFKSCWVQDTQSTVVCMPS